MLREPGGGEAGSLHALLCRFDFGTPTFLLLIYKEARTKEKSNSEQRMATENKQTRLYIMISSMGHKAQAIKRKT